MISREPSADELAGAEWWNSLSEPRRADWLHLAGSTKPADAWVEYKRRTIDISNNVTAGDVTALITSETFR